MDDTAALILKYKARLNPENEFKKIFRALQKLNAIEMTVKLLQATGVGKAVNSLRKTKGVGDFAKEIVNKWKKLVPLESTGRHQSGSPQRGYTPKVKSEPVEYDPAQNWEMTKQRSPYKPSVKQERVEDSEYDPSQNWQMETSQNDSDSSSYKPSTSPVKIKKEKSSPTRLKKRKRHEEERRTSGKAMKPDPGVEREAKIREKLQQTQKELRKMKDRTKRSEVKVKVERQSPQRKRIAEPPPSNGDIEEYDPHSNFELSNSPPTYDPGSPGSNQSYEPSQNEDEEYDPDPGSSSTSYQPSLTFDPRSSRVIEQEDDVNSEASYEEDEPGAYLLHPRRASSDFNQRHSSENSNDAQNTSDSFVLSTTLYQRNKSVDSEDGSWGSKVNGVKFERNDDTPYPNETQEKSSKSQKSVQDAKKSSKHKNRTEMRPEKSSKKSDKRTDSPKKHKSREKLGKLPKIKQEKDLDLHKSSKKLTLESGSKRTSSEKRKVNGETEPQPTKKKVKSSEVKVEKSEVKDAGFLFEDIPSVSNVNKKKKKKTKNNSYKPQIPSTSRATPKLNLHLPEIQASYRPLPHSSGGNREKRKSAEMPLTDSQAAELHSKRQTKKMLVYSGGTGGFIPKMMSLFDQCMKVLMNNIDAIDVFGGIPYDILEPVLKKCTPEQLYRLEDSNPYILEDTDELWQQHCVHEFRGKKPDEFESWREMYLRLSEEREAKLQSLTQMIQAKEAKKKPLEKKVMLAYVGANAKPPRSVRRAQERYGTAVKPRSSSVPSSSRSSTSAVRRELVNARMAIPEGTITAATVDREERFRQFKDAKKPRVAPMMAKTLKSIGKLRNFKR